MSVRQLSIFAENKNGSLYEITKILSDAKIDIRAFSVADTENFGVLRLIVNDSRAAAFALSEGGKVVSVNEVIGVKIADSTGGLTDLLRIITKYDVSVEYLYAFVSRKDNSANVVLRVDDNEAVEKILTAEGCTLLEDKDLQ